MVTGIWLMTNCALICDPAFLPELLDFIKFSGVENEPAFEEIPSRVISDALAGVSRGLLNATCERGVREALSAVLLLTLLPIARCRAIDPDFPVGAGATEAPSVGIGRSLTKPALTEGSVTATAAAY